MNAHSCFLAGLATFVVTASLSGVEQAQSNGGADSSVAARQALVAEISASVRDSLRAVMSEIALPGIAVEAPAPIAANR